MGHRKEIYRPRKRKEQISTQFEDKLKQEKLDDAIQLGLAHYSTGGTANAFAASLLATAEALLIAQEAEWLQPVESYVIKGISRAEAKTETPLNKFIKKTVYELVLNSLLVEKHRRGLD